MTARSPRALQARVDELEQLCAELYQFAGTVGAPLRVLDTLNAAAEGRPLPHETILPVDVSECTEVRAAVAAAAMGRIGGKMTSRQKTKSSRLNGRKGGRPAKFESGDRVIGREVAPASFRKRTGVIVERTHNRSEFYVRFDDRPKEPEPVYSWWIETAS